jgi:hypothetical protein
VPEQLLEAKLRQLVDVKQFRKTEVRKSATGWRKIIIDQLIAKKELNHYA